MAHEDVHREAVAGDSCSGDDSDGDRGNERAPPEILPGMDVGDVYLHDGALWTPVISSRRATDVWVSPPGLMMTPWFRKRPSWSLSINSPSWLL